MTTPVYRWNERWRPRCPAVVTGKNCGKVWIGLERIGTYSCLIPTARSASDFQPSSVLSNNRVTMNLSDKVVCIDDTPLKHGTRMRVGPPLQRGTVYAVRGLNHSHNGLGLKLVGQVIESEHGIEVGFISDRFRRLATRTEIESMEEPLEAPAPIVHH